MLEAEVQARQAIAKGGPEAAGSASSGRGVDDDEREGAYLGPARISRLRSGPAPAGPGPEPGEAPCGEPLPQARRADMDIPTSGASQSQREAYVGVR